MEQNVGFARGVNLAAGVATGTFLLLLNSDARLAPDALRLAVEWMRADPGCGVRRATAPRGWKQTELNRQLPFSGDGTPEQIPFADLVAEAFPREGAGISRTDGSGIRRRRIFSGSPGSMGEAGGNGRAVFLFPGGN